MSNTQTTPTTITRDEVTAMVTAAGWAYTRGSVASMAFSKGESTISFSGGPTPRTANGSWDYLGNQRIASAWVCATGYVAVDRHKESEGFMTASHVARLLAAVENGAPK